jgi:hypothetical protein
MRVMIAAATTVVAEIAVRFQNGDPATDALQRLQRTLLPALARHAAGGDLPDDIRAQIAALLDRVRAAVATGDQWLARTEPELIAQQARLRLRRAYVAR